MHRQIFLEAKCRQQWDLSLLFRLDSLNFPLQLLVYLTAFHLTLALLHPTIKSHTQREPQPAATVTVKFTFPVNDSMWQYSLDVTHLRVS